MENGKKTKKGFGKGFTFILALVIVIAGFLAYTYITNDSDKENDKTDSKQTTKKDKKNDKKKDKKDKKDEEKSDEKQSDKEKMNKVINKLNLEDYEESGELSTDISEEQEFYLRDKDGRNTDYEGALKRIYELEMRLNKYDRELDVDSADNKNTKLEKGSYVSGSESEYQEYANVQKGKNRQDDGGSSEEEDDEDSILDGIEKKQSSKIETGK